MPSDHAFAASVLARLDSLDVRVHPMFGEFVVYCGTKVVGLICDNTLFVKITDAGAAQAGRIGRGEPYPGARPHFRISRARLADDEWLTALVEITAQALPDPRPKRPRQPRRDWRRRPHRRARWRGSAR